jgi:hypothetical protein
VTSSTSESFSSGMIGTLDHSASAPFVQRRSGMAPPISSRPTLDRAFVKAMAGKFNLKETHFEGANRSF